MRNGISRERALDHGRAGMRAVPGLDELPRELGRFGLVAEEARSDQQELAHITLLKQASLRCIQI